MSKLNFIFQDSNISNILRCALGSAYQINISQLYIFIESQL